MTRIEKLQLLTDLVDQFMQRRERLLSKYPEMIKPGASFILNRLEIYRALRAIEGAEFRPAQPDLIMDLMASHLLHMAAMLAPEGTAECETDITRLEEIIGLYHQLYFKTESDDDARVFVGDNADLNPVFNRLESLGVPYLIVPCYEHSHFEGYANWSIQVTAEIYDLYQSKYRNAA